MEFQDTRSAASSGQTARAALQSSSAYRVTNQPSMLNGWTESLCDGFIYPDGHGFSLSVIVGGCDESKVVTSSYVGGSCNLNFEIDFCVHLFHDTPCRKKK